MPWRGPEIDEPPAAMIVPWPRNTCNDHPGDPADSDCCLNVCALGRLLLNRNLKGNGIQN